MRKTPRPTHAIFKKNNVLIDTYMKNWQDQTRASHKKN